MLKPISKYKINYKELIQYQTCDFITKYNLLQTNKKPYIKNVVLGLSAEALLNAFIGKQNFSSDVPLKLINALFFYVISGVLPYLTYKITNIAKGRKISSYWLKITLTNKKDILNFLHDIDKKFKWKKRKGLPLTKEKSSFGVKQKIKSSSFFETDHLNNLYLKSFNLQELNWNLRIKFRFRLLNTLISRKHFIRNFYFLN